MMIDKVFVVGILPLACILVALAITALWRALRCVHHWDLVDKTEFPPPIEEFHKRGIEITGGFMFPSDLRKMAQKTVVIVLRCNLCGKSRIDKITSDTD